MLSPEQDKAINLLVYTTFTKQQVANQVGVNPSTISRWFSNTEFKMAYDAAMENSFKEMATEAKQTVYKIMTKGERESNRLAAAKDILSRSGYDATNKVEQVSDTVITVNLVD